MAGSGREDGRRVWSQGGQREWRMEGRLPTMGWMLWVGCQLWVGAARGAHCAAVGELHGIDGEAALLRRVKK